MSHLANALRGRLRLLRAAWRLGQTVDRPHFAQALAVAAVNPDVSGPQLAAVVDLEEPFRSQCVIAFATCLSLPVGKVRELREFDDPFRSQCLSALMGNPGLDVATLRVLYAFADPYRTQCLSLLSSGSAVDVDTMRQIQAFADPFRSQCLSAIMFDATIDVAALHVLYTFADPYRTQCLALLSSGVRVHADTFTHLGVFDEPFRTRWLAVIAADPAVDSRTLQAIGGLAEPYRTLCLGLAVTRRRASDDPARALTGTPAAAASSPPGAAAAAAPEIDVHRAAEFAGHRPEVPGHADVFFRDLLGASEPVFDDERHLRAALDWLLHSRDVTGTAGFAAAYSFKHGWLPPYPETTGYIIPTFWAAAHELRDERYRDAARRAADWEIEIQLESGAIQAGYLGVDPDGFWNAASPVPAAFNTGQVVLGWNRTYEETGEPKYLDAAIRACRFLAGCVDDSGVFRQGLSPGPKNPTRSYYTRVAWAMAWTSRLCGDPAFEAAAVRHLDWVVKHQQPDGWFQFASFLDDEKPLTHTMAYTAEGLLHAGVLLGNEGYVKASERHAIGAMTACERRGLFLPGFFSEGWKSREQFSCLPGNAQFATLWLQHAQRCGDLPLANTGLKMVDWLKARQALENPEPGIRGGLAGAWPIDGGYSVFSYVNWAAKYFADALIEARRVRRELLDAS